MKRTWLTFCHDRRHGNNAPPVGLRERKKLQTWQALQAPATSLFEQDVV